MLLADQSGDFLYFFSFRDSELREIAAFAGGRAELPSFRFLEMVGCDEVVLVSYELGLVCVVASGEVRWRVAHAALGVRLESVDNGVVRCHDAEGNDASYSLEDGSEVY